MRLVVIISLLAIGCGGSAGAPAKTSTPQEPAGTASITQTTELTSATMPAPKGLDSRQIRARLDSHLPELVDRCGELQWETDRYETSLHLEIAASGKVDLADARGNNTRLDACVAEVARTWTFDQANVRTVANVPLVIERP